jgi:hypothetical protein
MTKATAAYLGMFLVLIAGLGIILQCGSSLSAPPDIRGRWILTYDPPSTVPAQLFIEQSGLYLRGALGDKRLRGRTQWNDYSAEYVSEMESTDHTLTLIFAPAHSQALIGTVGTRPFTAIRDSRPAPGTDAR